MFESFDEFLTTLKALWQVSRKKEVEDVEKPVRGAFRILLLALFLVPLAQTLASAFFESMGPKVFLAFLPVFGMIACAYFMMRLPVLTGVVLADPLPKGAKEKLEPVSKAFRRFFGYLLAGFGIDTLYGFAMAVFPGYRRPLLTMLLYVLIAAAIFFIPMPKGEPKKWLTRSIAAAVALIVIAVIWPTEAERAAAKAAHEKAAAEKTQAQAALVASQQKPVIPDCASQKDVNFENGETVKRIPLAPCKSGWITTPPATKWFADSLPVSLNFTLCYQDGDCVYYDGTNKWNGVKRGIFQAVGDGRGELVVTVEYPKGTKPQGETTAEANQKPQEEESSFEGTVSEILTLDGRLTVKTSNGEERHLRPGNALLYGKGWAYDTWWKLREGDRVRVALENNRVRYIKYLG